MTAPIYPAAEELYPVVRQSTLSAFDNCELAAFFEHEHKHTTHPQMRGRTAHEVFAECLRLMIANDEPTINPDVALEVLDEKLRQRDVLPEDRGSMSMNHEKDLRWIVAKWALENSFSTHNIVAVEERLTTSLEYELDGVKATRPVTGQLDVLMIDENNDAIVIDWKDTWGMPGPKEISEDGYFQQMFYALLVFANYPAVQTVTLREFYVRYTEPREAVITRDRWLDLKATFSALVERFDRAWEAQRQLQKMTNADIEAAWPDPDDMPEPFQPTPGSHCSYCKLPERCPIFPGARGPGAVTNAQEAAVAAAQLVVAQSIVKKTGDALRAFARENGPVPIKSAKRNLQIGYVESKRTARPTREEIDEAIKNMPSGSLPHEIQAKVDSLYKTSKSTTFKTHTPPKEDDDA